MQKRKLAASRHESARLRRELEGVREQQQIIGRGVTKTAGTACDNPASVLFRMQEYRVQLRSDT
jgi:hypothetical protein